MKNTGATVGNVLEAMEAALGPKKGRETVGQDTVFDHACLLLLLTHTPILVAGPSSRGNVMLPDLK
jgi:hypothetical protein